MAIPQTLDGIPDILITPESIVKVVVDNSGNSAFSELVAHRLRDRFRASERFVLSYEKHNGDLVLNLNINEDRGIHAFNVTWLLYCESPKITFNIYLVSLLGQIDENSLKGQIEMFMVDTERVLRENMDFINEFRSTTR